LLAKDPPDTGPLVDSYPADSISDTFPVGYGHDPLTL
jgi:hypothetical protein